MTYASDPDKTTLQGIARNVIEAVGNGAAAHSNGEQGLATLAATIGFLKNARTHALQELGHIVDAIAGLKALFEGTIAPELDQAIALLNIAKDKVELYANNLSRILEDLETYHLGQVEGDLTNLMDSSGLQMRQAAEAITQFINNL